jgi:pimeloyl-ACP methyl ester carboxylesterase
VSGDVEPVHRQWFRPWDRRDRRATPVVLLHEGLGSISTWGTFPQSLADVTHREVLAYDRPGHGASPGLEDGPWTARFLHHEAVRLAELVRAEELDEVILAGHSDGASIALLEPSQAPTGAATVSGIVCLAAHVLVEDRTVDAIGDLRRQVADETTGLISLLGRHHDQPARLFERWSEVWVSDRFRAWAIDRELVAVTCPVLALQGEADAYGTRLQLDRLAAAVTGPVEVHELRGVDHWPHREATEGVLSRIAEFCDRIAT